MPAKNERYGKQDIARNAPSGRRNLAQLVSKAHRQESRYVRFTEAGRGGRTSAKRAVRSDSKARPLARGSACHDPSDDNVSGDVPAKGGHPPCRATPLRDPMATRVDGFAANGRRIDRPSPAARRRLLKLRPRSVKRLARAEG